MSELLYDLINVPYLPTGRQLYALKLCLEIAESKDEKSLITLIQEAIAHGTATVGLEMSWSRSKSISKGRGESTVLDGQIDGVLGAIHAAVNNNISVLDADDPIVEASKTIASKLFPEGVVAIIHLPFEEQLALNTVIVDALSGELSSEAEASGVAKYVGRLKSLNDRFREELTKTATKEVDFSVVQAAQDRGNLFIRRIVAVILGTHHRETEADVSARRDLLAPILEQGERVRQLRKSRRAPPDVNPETGEDIV